MQYLKKMWFIVALVVFGMLEVIVGIVGFISIACGALGSATIISNAFISTDEIRYSTGNQIFLVFGCGLFIVLLASVAAYSLTILMKKIDHDFFHKIFE